MTKVVYNACYGGFSLSTAAVLRERELSGNPKWADATLPGEMYGDGSGPCKGFSSYDSVHIDNSFPRHDQTLVRVVEELGDKASGALAKLRIAEVSGPYRIDKYDGSESVETPDSYDWIKP